MKPYLIFEGEKYSVHNISFDLSGEVNSVSVTIDEKYRTFVSESYLSSDYDKLDFSTCLKFEADESSEVAAIEKSLIDEIEIAEQELSAMASAAIPKFRKEFHGEEYYSKWSEYHLKKSHIEGLVDALDIVKCKGEMFSM